MDLGGSVVDTECAQVGEDAGDDRFIRDTLPAEHLYAAIDNAPSRLRFDDLGAARFDGGVDTMFVR